MSSSSDAVIASLYAKKYSGDVDGSEGGGSAAAGDELVKKAEKKLKALFGSNKKEKAAELYEQAAQAYGYNQNWTLASKAMVIHNLYRYIVYVLTFTIHGCNLFHI